MLPDSAKIAVYESECEAYAAEFGVKRLLTVPDEKSSLSAKARWVQETTQGIGVVFVQDDIKSVWCVVGAKPRQIVEPAAVHRLILTTAWMAIEAGVSCFSFASTANPRKFSHHDPIGLRTIGGPVIGVLGKRVLFDERLPAYELADLNLQALLVDRWVISDNRFAFETSPVEFGGSTHMRTADHLESARSVLTSKWGVQEGGNWGIKSTATGDNVVVTTERRVS